MRILAAASWSQLLSCRCTEDVIIVRTKTTDFSTQSPNTLAHHLAHLAHKVLLGSTALKDPPASMAQMADQEPTARKEFLAPPASMAQIADQELTAHKVLPVHQESTAHKDPLGQVKLCFFNL